MAIALRKTGISVVGDLPWGTHFCHFYETKQDLLDTLVPYFKAGLESSEFCMWVVSNSESLTMEEAKGALAQAVPDLERHLSDGNIEILNGLDWYLEQNVFNLERVKSGWDARLKRALDLGYDGIRISGDTFWLREKDWKDFCAYEKQINDSITDRPMTVLCTYPLAKSGAAETLDVVQNHQFSIARRRGEWKVIESPELMQAKAEIKRLNEELEQRVIERINELRVNERKDHHRLVIDAIPTMAWSLRPDGVLDFVNQRWLDYTGLSFEEAIEQPTRTVHPEDLSRVMEKWLVVKATSEVYEDEMRMQRADGEYRWFLVRIAPLLDEQGSLLERYGVAIDIEERKRAEEKLKQSESQLAEAQRLAHVGSWDYDLRTNSVTWSDELYRIFGIQPGKIKVACDAMPLIHPEDRDLVFRTVKSAIKSQEPYSFYYRVLKPDGNERIVHSRGFIVSNENGNPIRVVGATQDVTELKRAEEKLKATSEQLRSLSASLQAAKEEETTRIAREIHDELGATLSSLRWDLEGIDEALSGSGERPQVEELRQKIAAMMRLSDITVNTVRRIASELRPVVLDTLGLGEAIEWHARQFQERTGVVVQCDCDQNSADLSEEQSTAAFRISQEALTNILRHAQATTVHIQMREEDGEFILAISDNGRGITDDEKLGQSTLGLLGMRERAHLVGAKIDITGSEGKGTVVVVRIPISANT